MCAAEEEERRQREVDRIRLAREAEIRRTNQLFRQQRLQQQGSWQPQHRARKQPAGRIPAGAVVDTRGPMLPATNSSVPTALPSFTHSQRSPAPVTRQRPSTKPAARVDHDKDEDEVGDTTEFTPLI